MGSGTQFEYRVWRQGELSYRSCYSLSEVKAMTGIKERDIKYAIEHNRGFNGWYILRYNMKDGRAVIGQYIDDARRKDKEKIRTNGKQPYDTDGVMGIDADGVSHWYKDVIEASEKTKIPRLHIRECLKEGSAYEGWCFDYPLKGAFQGGGA